MKKTWMEISLITIQYDSSKRWKKKCCIHVECIEMSLKKCEKRRKLPRLFLSSSFVDFFSINWNVFARNWEKRELISLCVLHACHTPVCRWTFALAINHCCMTSSCEAVIVRENYRHTFIGAAKYIHFLCIQ